MSLCDISYPPEDCVALRYWLWDLVQILTYVDPVKCGTGTADPSAAQLEALWGTCDVPPGAFAVWYNSVGAETTYWYCKDGSVVGCGWTELVL